jgi:hypothetical protein
VASGEQSLGGLLDRAARRDRRRLLVLGALWAAGVAVLLAFLLYWSGRFRAMEERLVTLQAASQVAEAQASGASASVAAITRTLTGTGETIGRLADEQQKQRAEADVIRLQLQADARRFEDAARHSSAMLARLSSDMRRINADLSRVPAEVVAARDAVDAVRTDVATVEGQVREAAVKFKDIERQLQTAHYVFRSNSNNQVWGMDLFLSFGAIEKTAGALGIPRLCVSRKALPQKYLKKPRTTDCVWGPGFAKFGAPIHVPTDGFEYTITVRHYVKIPILHDQVGFDINREADAGGGGRTIR